MKTYEIKNKLKDYDKLINLYANLISHDAIFDSLKPEVKLTNEDGEILKIQAFGKKIEVRFSMIIKAGYSRGKITAFLLKSEGCQPVEEILLSTTFDISGNFQGELPLSACDIYEEETLLTLVHLILKNLIQNEITEPN